MDTCRLRSLIPFRRLGAAEPTAALDHANILHSSAGLGWNGLDVEVGENDGWAVDDLLIGGHYLAVNLDDAPLVIERKSLVGFKRTEIPPGTLWVQPAGEPFTFRVAATCRYAGVVLDTDRARSLVGADLDLDPGYGVAEPTLLRVVQAVVAEVADGAKAGRLFVDGMAAALAAQLAARHGTLERAAKGGITPRRLRRVVEFIDAHLAESLPLDALAGFAGLSPFHFARAFKQTTGTTPHRFVLDRRLARAKDLLARGDLGVAEVAHACGFADHAHLTRTFRRHFGLVPSALLQADRR